MIALKSLQKSVPGISLRGSTLNPLSILFTAIACISAISLESIDANAQQWIYADGSTPTAIAPIAQSSAATHLVIEPPQPPKRHHWWHHGLPQITAPTQPELVGGGYWNRPSHLPPSAVDQEEMVVHDAFRGGELPPPAPPKKKINLTHAIPAHADKTPRSPAIPQASRTTGWKQPYSYGHFGAKHNRQWSVHHGHQRSHTQWTFR
jgi:hypothetical protein